MSLRLHWETLSEKQKLFRVKKETRPDCSLNPVFVLERELEGREYICLRRGETY